MITVKVTDSTGASISKQINLVVEQPQTNQFPLIFGGATTNDQQKFNQINQQWGPIRMSREYDSGGGIRAVQNYSWFNFVKNNFKYLSFSCDEGNSDYPRIANGVFDDKIRTMLNSLSNLPGVKGVINLGNEPNAKSKNINPSDWRAAMEHVMDTFGDEPVPGWYWSIAFTNYNAWGGGSTQGELWLPRRTGSKFCVETHVYGKSDWTLLSSSLGRTFIPAMKRYGRENWIWGIGETSAQENPNNPDTKGNWFKDSADYVSENGGSFYLPFDTGVGGSDEVGSSARTQQLVKQIAIKYQNNNWS